MCRSPVFYAMFHGELAEKGDVTVDDIDPEAFRQMLKYAHHMFFSILRLAFSKFFLTTMNTSIKKDVLHQSALGSFLGSKYSTPQFSVNISNNQNRINQAISQLTVLGDRLPSIEKAAQKVDDNTMTKSRQSKQAKALVTPSNCVNLASTSTGHISAAVNLRDDFRAQ